MIDAREHLLVRHFGRCSFEPVWHAMQAFTDRRTARTPDELWLLEHSPVFTLGQAARPEHVLEPGGIPVIRIDRGGQVTYHGPGQLVAYLLLDLRRANLGVKRLVQLLEQSVIEVLAGYGIRSGVRSGAPGVYVAHAKIAALGLRVRRGCCFHGLALNVDMDLTPFSRINPCGYPGLAVTSIAELGRAADVERVQEDLAAQISLALGRQIRIGVAGADGNPEAMSSA